MTELEFVALRRDDKVLFQSDTDAPTFPCRVTSVVGGERHRAVFLECEAFPASYVVKLDEAECLSLPPKKRKPKETDQPLLLERVI